MKNDVVSATNITSLPADQQIILAIKKRHDLNPKQEELIFELGKLGVALNNKNDYLEIIAILDGLKEKAGFDYAVEDTYTDRRGKSQHYTLFESRLCKIKINDKKRFENYCVSKLNQILTSDDEIKGEEKPYCITEGVWGYLKFGKHGRKKKIGKSKSKSFRLLQCLIGHLGVARTVDTAFEAIRLPKDRDDSLLTDSSTAQRRKIDLITYTIKELQKKNKLEGKIKLEFIKEKTQVMARFIG